MFATLKILMWLLLPTSIAFAADAISAAEVTAAKTDVTNAEAAFTLARINYRDALALARTHGLDPTKDRPTVQLKQSLRAARLALAFAKNRLAILSRLYEQQQHEKEVYKDT